MNNKNNEGTFISEEEIFLSPPVEIFDEAKNIALNCKVKRTGRQKMAKPRTLK